MNDTINLDCEVSDIRTVQSNLTFKEKRMIAHLRIISNYCANTLCCECVFGTIAKKSEIDMHAFFTWCSTTLSLLIATKE
jgi:hypothetical protein